MLAWHGAIMSDAHSREKLADFVRTPIGQIDICVNAIAGHEDETGILAMLIWARTGARAPAEIRTDWRISPYSAGL